MEILVSSVLVLLLMGGIWMMLRSGSRFYLKVRGQSEVQRSALLALRWLSKDLAEAAPLSFKHYKPTSATAPSVHPGMVFGSSRDLDGNLIYDAAGQLQWRTMIGYYIDPTTRILYRTIAELPSPQNEAPIVDDTLYHIDILAAQANRRKIVEHVFRMKTVPGPRDMLIKLHCRNEKLGVGLSVQTRLEMKNK